MSTLDSICAPIGDHLAAFEPYFRRAMRSRVPLLGVITNYIYRRKGKQIRPMLVFLSAGASGGINQSTYVGAGMIELLHTATLMHDDVVDEAYERRGAYSINAIWRSKTAVLMGDFLLSRGLLLALETNELELLRNMSHSVAEMVEGEMIQTERARRMDVDEATYLTIIRKKTATLFASACVNGACSAKAPPQTILALQSYGYNLGMAFQIHDDLLDYRPRGLLGKPTGNDIRERMLTLPLIYSLAQCGPAEKRSVLALIRRSRADGKALAEVIRFANRSGGVEYAHSVMRHYVELAVRDLQPMEPSVYSQSLIALAEYISRIDA